MKEKDPVLEALHDGHKSLQQISSEIRDVALAFRELTDAITVLLIYIDGGTAVGHIASENGHRVFHRSAGFQEAVNRVRDALEGVVGQNSLDKAEQL